MNLNDLKYFKYTAKYKNITKAAKHFYVSQSTLSRNIMSLETELGVKLFKRTNKNITLTPAGEQLYKECDLLIKHIEAITKNVQSVEKNGKGNLRIALPSIMDSKLYEKFKEYKKLNPNTNIFIEIYDFEELTSSVLHGIYDVAFTYNFALEPNESIKTKYITKDTFSLILPKDYYEKPTVDNLTELIQNLPLILPNTVEPPFMKNLLYEFGKLYEDLTFDKIYVNTTESAILKTSLGLGFSIIPTSVFKLNVNNKYVDKVDLEDFNTDAKIIMMYKNNILNDAAENFIKFIEESFE
ncbi:MAG: LysR family transcriptional regulator [Lachnospirales bacterium]